MELEKCRRSIDSIKGQIFEAQKKFIDYNRLRYGDSIGVISTMIVHLHVYVHRTCEFIVLYDSL